MKPLRHSLNSCSCLGLGTVAAMATVELAMARNGSPDSRGEVCGMDLITLIATCAPMVAPITMKAIVLEESRGHPYAIHDGKTHRAIFPKTREEAIATARRLVAAGHRIDAGLAQINSENWDWLGLSPETVFDPCTNLAAGERVLIDAYARAPFSVDAAISRYNSGDAERGVRNGYVSRVKAWMPKPQPDRQYEVEDVPIERLYPDRPRGGQRQSRRGPGRQRRPDGPAGTGPGPTQIPHNPSARALALRSRARRLRRRITPQPGDRLPVATSSPTRRPARHSFDILNFEGETRVTNANASDPTTRGIAALALLGGLLLAPEIASANVLDNFGDAILGILNNTFLRAVAIVAVIGAGLMALSGRIQWMSFISVMIAVVIIFGSAGIVDYIRDNSATAALDPAPVVERIA